MKIIQCDNFAREDQPEHLVADNITSESLGKIMLEALQATCHAEGSVWYKMVPNDYRLSRGMADLVE